MLYQNYSNPVIQICNRALRLLSHASITSLEDSSVESEACKFLYYNLKAELLSSYPWKAAVKVINLQTLQLSSTEQKNLKLGFTYKFMLPSDCLRIISVNSGNNYTKDGLYVYTSNFNSCLTYISNIEEKEFNINFSYLLSLRLALELSYNFSDGISFVKHFSDLFNDEYKKLTQADSTNGISVITENNEEPTWITSRY